MERLEQAQALLGDNVAYVGKAESSWYKPQSEILVAERSPETTHFTPSAA